jgi:hypothetical protein
MTPHERGRLDAAIAGKSAAPVPTTRQYVLEDPSKFGPGHVVVADGSKRRMMIVKIVTGFAQCIWFSPQTFEDSGGQHIGLLPRHEIVHTSMLTLDADQKWISK